MSKKQEVGTSHAVAGAHDKSSGTSRTAGPSGAHDVSKKKLAAKAAANGTASHGRGKKK